ncbi:MAG: fumarylacetoacetase [Flavobacteriales bacterium]|nr:fumarylacetoacetase [Flavobacteriales bacterium]
MAIPANDLSLRSWLPVPADSDFPIQNIPFGVFSSPGRFARIGTRVGDTIVDLFVLAEAELFSQVDVERIALMEPSLNRLLKHGDQRVRAVRQRLIELLAAGHAELRDDAALRDQALVPVSDAVMHVPASIGDYTDFYSSRQHAYNVGVMFRDPANALLPNWLHLPVGYHGRASSIVPTDAAIRRPCGPYKPSPEATPVFGPTHQLDFELEMGFLTYDGKPLGERIPTAEAEARIFGLALFNDWSARDIQAWEYVPLGPFLGKNFASSISPWVVTLDALEPFRVPGPVQEPPVLPYLQYTGNKHYDIKLEVAILTSGGSETVICRSNFKHLYWNMAQQLAHHTVNGCNVRAGDLMASGTISGDTPESYGSMLELSWKGTKPVKLNDGTERRFIEDGDTVIMRGYCEKEGLRIGFGEVRATVLPALPFDAS